MRASRHGVQYPFSWQCRSFGVSINADRRTAWSRHELEPFGVGAGWMHQILQQLLQGHVCHVLSMGPRRLHIVLAPNVAANASSSPGILRLDRLVLSLLPVAAVYSPMSCFDKCPPPCMPLSTTLMRNTPHDSCPSGVVIPQLLLLLFSLVGDLCVIAQEAMLFCMLELFLALLAVPVLPHHL